jgi:hypothetical protein
LWILCWCPPYTLAEIVKACSAVTAEADAVKLAATAPATTETVPGTPIAALLLVTVMPVVTDAALERVMVQLVFAGPTTTVGVQTNDEMVGVGALTVTDPGMELTWTAELLPVAPRLALRPMLELTADGASVSAMMANVPEGIVFWFMPTTKQVCEPPAAGAQVIDFPDEVSADPGCQETAETLAVG